MLDSFLLPIVYQWYKYEELHFMQKGKPPQFALPVRGGLPGLQTGRRGSTKWPTRSPDCTSYNLFLWDWAK